MEANKIDLIIFYNMSHNQLKLLQLPINSTNGYSAMVVCTFLSAPMMFMSAQLLTLTSIRPSQYISLLDNFLLDISVLGLLATLWTIFVFLVSKNWRSMPHCQTLVLVASQW